MRQTFLQNQAFLVHTLREKRLISDVKNIHIELKKKFWFKTQTKTEKDYKQDYKEENRLVDQKQIILRFSSVNIFIPIIILWLLLLRVSVSAFSFLFWFSNWFSFHFHHYNRHANFFGCQDESNNQTNKTNERMVTSMCCQFFFSFTKLWQNTDEERNEMKWNGERENKRTINKRSNENRKQKQNFCWIKWMI